MARNLIIVDSCVFISAFRNNAHALKQLEAIKNQTAYSVITQLELLFGATTNKKKEIVQKILASYYGIPLNPQISFKAAEIMHKHVTGQKVISIPDCLIAATAIVTGYQLLTSNFKDFEFIEGIKLLPVN